MSFRKHAYVLGYKQIVFVRVWQDLLLALCSEINSLGARQFPTDLTPAPKNYFEVAK